MFVIYLGKSIRKPITWRNKRYVFDRNKDNAKLEIPNDLAEFLFQKEPGSYTPCLDPKDEKILEDFKSGKLVYVEGEDE